MNHKSDFITHALNAGEPSVQTGGGFSEVFTRVDGNQVCITNDLQMLSCSVQDLSMVGRGCPDIIVGFQNKNYLFEIKNIKGKLNQRQQHWHALWQGQVSVIRTLEDAIEIIGIKIN